MCEQARVDGRVEGLLLDSCSSTVLMGKQDKSLVVKFGSSLKIRVKTWEGQSDVQAQRCVANLGFTLVDAIYCEDRDVSLVSVGVLDRLGFTCKFGKKKVLVYRGETEDHLVATGILTDMQGQASSINPSKHNNIYMLQVLNRQEGQAKNLAEVKGMTAATIMHTTVEIAKQKKIEIVHQRLGHPSYRRLRKIEEETDGLFSRIDANCVCEACILGKSRRLARRATKGRKPRPKPLQVIHSDVFGPTRVQGFQNQRYCLIVYDQGR